MLRLVFLYMLMLRVLFVTHLCNRRCPSKEEVETEETEKYIKNVDNEPRAIKQNSR